MKTTDRLIHAYASLIISFLVDDKNFSIPLCVIGVLQGIIYLFKICSEKE